MQLVFLVVTYIYPLVDEVNESFCYVVAEFSIAVSYFSRTCV